MLTMFHVKPKCKSNAKKSAKKSAKASTLLPTTPSTTFPVHSAILPVLPFDALPSPSLDPPPPYAVLCPSGHDCAPQPPPRPPKVPIPTTTTRRMIGAPQITHSIHTPQILPSTTLPISSHKGVKSNSNGLVEVRQMSLEPAIDEILCDLISTKLDAVITAIDKETFAGQEIELTICEDRPSGIRGGGRITSREVSRGANKAISSAVVSTNYFAKVNVYTNSRLPPNLPPLKL